MQHLYIRRRFSGWGLQPGISRGLLLGSAGLVAALLLYTVAYGDTALGGKWQAANLTPGTHFASSQLTSTKVPLAAFANEPRSYWIATAVAYRHPASTLPGPLLAEPATGPDQDDSSLTGTVKAAMQHSWTTIKLAFR